MANSKDASESFSHGLKPPRITKRNGLWELIVNEASNPLTKSVISGAESVSIVEIMREKKTNPYRYQGYQFVNQTAKDSDWIYDYHAIDMQAILAKTHESPRYFYRVVSDKSGGINTAECFQSEAVKQGSRAEMASMTEKDVRENLLAHMRDKTFPSHWISFTLSPLWAFDRALRLKRQGEKDISIAVIDTLYLARPVLIFHTPALLQAYRLNDAMWPIMNRGAS